MLTLTSPDSIAADSSRRLKIAIAGSSGLVGSELVPFLLKAGHQVIRLIRSGSAGASQDGATSVSWKPDHGELHHADLEGIDAVINLAGVGIADKRWSQERKNLIRCSRVASTRLLAETISKLKQKPTVFFSASAIGYYPPSGDQQLDEDHPPGNGFLPGVCQAWEASTKAAEEAGIRTVHGRIGIVLSARGGALAAQLPLFRWCLGGRLGPGTQYMPWIDIGDLVRAIHFCLMNDAMQGAVNLTAPGCTTNQEFTQTLARVLNKPAMIPAPAWALRLALGEMADALLLASLRVVPRRLQQAGFTFEYSELEKALRHQLKR